MDIDIRDEYSTLKGVVVGKGTSVPDYKDYIKSRYDYLKEDPHDSPYDKELLIAQQSRFLNVLRKHNVKLLFVDENNKFPWQMWTRDIGFVYRNKMFYSVNRRFKESIGEFTSISKHFKNNNNLICVKKGRIEGGDVIADKNNLYIGVSQNTDLEAIKTVEKHFPVKIIFLGEKAMHLDTRMAILPNNHMLIHTQDFEKADLRYLKKRFSFIRVTKKEAENMATNVLAINPKTIVIHSGHKRIQKELRKREFVLEIIDYSESIRLEGSFRCTTLPTQRIYS